MRAVRGIRIGCGLALALLAFSACQPATPLRLDPDELALLRLEYLERAAELPAIKITSIVVPPVDRIGRFSPVVWKIRSEHTPGRELFRPLPIDDIDVNLYDTLTRTLEDFGFNVRGWTRQPELRLRVEVENLVLLSENGSEERQACELSLRFHIDENPSGLEIESFQSSADWETAGSWMQMRGEEAVWTPRDSSDDPIKLAAKAVTYRFLEESLDFWKTPAYWEEGRIQLSNSMTVCH